MLSSAMRGMIKLLFKVQTNELSRVPFKGPLIVVINHVNFFDTPVLYSTLRPRQVIGFAKAESWDNPLYGAIFDMWGAIPLQRGEVDRQAIRQALQAIRSGSIFAMAPEGTRSKTGIMQRGKTGMVTLATLGDAPIQPIGIYGHESYRQDFRHLRRSAFMMRVGDPFRVLAPKGRLTREIRQQITDEVMYQIAAKLPHAYRGVYADLSQATTEFLQFSAGARSALEDPNPESGVPCR